MLTHLPYDASSERGERTGAKAVWRLAPEFDAEVELLGHLTGDGPA
jgi:hypothetical protein